MPRSTCLPLVNGQEPVRHTENQNCHRRGIAFGRWQISPATVLALLVDQRVADLGVPGLKVLFTGLVHGLNRVVVGVVEPSAIVGIDSLASQILQAALHLLGITLAAQDQGDNAGSGAADSRWF